MSLAPEETKVYEVLEKLGISYTRHEHPPVYTFDEAEKYWTDIKGVHCKNLFLRNKKGNHHYLVILEGSKHADLRKINAQLGDDRLSFGSPERLKRYLGLEPGSVSPFGLINDHDHSVEVVIDQDLSKASSVNFHPNVNTATIGISLADFDKFLSWAGSTVRYLQID
jgi:Ala-tRNA(Pro) deacylase